MANKSPLQETQDLLQKAKNLLEQNQLTEPIELFLEEAAIQFEAQNEWELYLQAIIQWAVFYIKTSKYTLAESLLISALQKTKPFVFVSAIEVGDVYNQLAAAAYYQANYPIAQHYFWLALQVYQTNYGEQHQDTAKAYSNLGNCAYAQSSVQDALTYYQKSLEIRQAVLPPNHPHFAFSYSALGRCHHTSRNYKKALLFFQYALEIRIHQYGPEHLMVSYSYTDVSSCYLVLFDYAKARECSQKALAIRQKVYPAGHPTIAHCLSQIADTYLKEGNPKEAIAPFQSAVRLQLDLLGENHPDLAYNFAELGKCFLEIQPEKCLDYFHKALKIYQQTYGDYHKQTARLFDYIGRYYHQQKEYEQALQSYQKSINSLCNLPLEEVSESHIYQKPSIDNQLSHERLSKPIVGKAEIFCELYEQNQSLQAIQAAYEHSQQLIQLLGQIRQQQSAEKEQLFLSQEAASFFDLAIEIALMMYQETEEKEALEEAFLFAEQGKAMSLLSSLQKNRAKHQSNIPAEVLKEVKSLEIKVSELEKQIKITSESLVLRQLQKKLFQATRQHEILTAQLEREYPEYYQLKYKMPILGVQELQKELKNQQAENKVDSTTLLLSYYVSEKYIFIFEITSDSYEVHQMEKSNDLEETILDFQDAISLMDIDDYVEASTELYELLLAPVLDKHGLPTVIPQKMIVLRHDLLDYLPFEALLTANDVDAIVSPSFAQLPYLIHYYEISYHYSTALLISKLQQSQSTSVRQNSFLGFAPVSFNSIEGVELELESRKGKSRVLRSNRAGEVALQNLPSTETEVKEVYQLFQDKSLDAKAFLYASASKANLIKEASKHKYVLISTHGFVEDEEAGLSGIYLAKRKEVGSEKWEMGNEKREVGSEKWEMGEEDKHSNLQTPEHIDTTQNNYLLYTSDTYHLDLQADLVVLSSCSSGIGKLQKGEGMMAINRGFLYAGASNIIFTQFDIPDHSSSLLVKKLFEYILEGDSYSAALRKSKLFLLKEKASSVQDWAGYLLIGS